MFKLFCLSVLVAAASAMVCIPEMCHKENCAAVTTENCNGKVREHGGFCGCCDACITQLSEGAWCRRMHTFGGPPDTYECADGLSCDPKTGTCQKMLVKKDTTACQKHMATYNAIYASHPGWTGLKRPHCAADGMYKGMQISGSRAYCVTSNGTLISGYMVDRWETVDTRGADMNCQCARDEFVYKKAGLFGKSYHCFANGNYPEVACMGSVCYCQDGMGKQVGNSTVSIGQKDSINC